MDGSLLWNNRTPWVAVCRMKRITRLQTLRLLYGGARG